MANWFVVLRSPALGVDAVREVIGVDERVDAHPDSDGSVALALEAPSSEDAQTLAVAIARRALSEDAPVEVALVYDEQLQVVMESPAEAQRDTLDEIDDLIAALGEPLTREDRAGGWNIQNRDNARDYFVDLREDLRAGRSPGGAPHHLARWLDFAGIGDGPLAARIYDLQGLLHRRFAKP